MKTLLSLVVALLLTTVTFAQQTATTNSAQDPTAISNTFFKAMLDEDGTTLGKVLANDFRLTSFDGQTIEAEQLVQAVSGGYVVIETGVVSNTQTRQYNSDSAVMTGNWKIKGAIQGQPLEANAAFSVVSAKQGNDWKIVNLQFTPTK